MTGPKLIDEINRLFEQLVRDPWARAPQRSPRTHVGEAQLEIALPVAPGQRDDISVAIEGRRLVVRVHHASGHGAAPATSDERVITLPEDAEVAGLEAQFEGAALHVRVRLRPTHRRA
ncbi:MAG TPA: Hsp20/alpha crystallin family protein [Candidatus Dormibacteraeota bacterium]|nr:Hsp20/alpha crystallin family protein [Candidatus Dormibacteraeota bacterium]